MKRSRSILFYGLLIIGLFSIYFSSLHHNFTHLDDHVQVVENLSIRSIDIESITHIFSSTTVGMYQPLTTLFNAIIYQNFGLNAFYYHFLSLLFHLFNSILVFKLLSYFFKSKNLSFFLSFLFAFHPMQVESVAWVSALSSLTFTFFFLASIFSYFNYRKSYKKKFYYIALVLFILACLSKSSAVILPIILILFELFQGDKVRSIWKNKISFLFVSIFFGIITLLSRESAGHLSDLSENFDWIDRIFLVSHSILFYPFTFLFPFKLSAFYPYPEIENSSLPILYYLSPIVLVGLSILIYKFKSNRKIWFGTIFYFIGIALVLQIIPVGNQITTDRYIYLPMFGLLIILASVLSKLQDKKAFNVLFLIPLFLGFLSFERSKIWKNDEQLWKSVLEEYPNVSQAYNNLGSSALENKKPQEAFNYFDKAIQLQPSYADAYSNRGNLYSQSGKSSEAIKDYSKAIALKEHADAYFNRGNEFSKVGDLNSAVVDYTKSLSLTPKSDTYTNRAFAYLKLNKTALAKNDLNQALTIDAKFDRAIFLMGLIERNSGNQQLACQFFQKAMSLGNVNAKSAYLKSCR
ncbi:MAG: tetratricopeptide repeat protein [Flavobacteriales bacterium]|nr:tetratricopeptide repeat protein [Flavobacteriales bacterium]